MICTVSLYLQFRSHSYDEYDGIQMSESEKLMACDTSLVDETNGMIYCANFPE